MKSISTFLGASLAAGAAHALDLVSSSGLHWSAVPGVQYTSTLRGERYLVVHLRKAGEGQSLVYAFGVQESSCQRKHGEVWLSATYSSEASWSSWSSGDVSLSSRAAAYVCSLKWSTGHAVAK